jgi:hypothetical protein
MAVPYAVSHIFNVPTLKSCLNKICLLEFTELRQLVASVIPDSRLPWDYLDGLNNNDRAVAYCALMLAWAVTGGTQIPREMQL